MNILIIGASSIDVIAHSNSRILAQHESEGSVKFRHGGVARNIAELLTRLDISCKILTVVGDDVAGANLLAGLKQMGVDTELSIQVSDMSTSANIHILDLEGDVYTSITGPCLAHRLTADIIQNASIDETSIILADSTLDFNTLHHIAFETTAKKKIFEPVSYFEWTDLTEILPQFDIIALNKFQAERLRGGMITGVADAKDCAKYLLNEKGLQTVFIILDEYGSVAANNDTLVHVPAFQSKSFTKPGAEQAYTAAIIYGLYNELTFYQTALFAQACYALALDLPQGEMNSFTLQKVSDVLRDSTKVDTESAEKVELERRQTSYDDEEIAKTP